MRIIIASLIVVGGLLTMTIAEARQAPQPGSDPNFTGVVTSLDAKDVTAGRRNFEAGARTAWHSHDKGQLIYAESGRMRTGRRGEAFKEYAAGGSEYTAPNVEHWHGATPKEPLVQVNIQFGGTTKWLTRTTDEEYNRGK
jgi:quercetin dioxygenase-like cupin family protein